MLLCYRLFILPSAHLGLFHDACIFMAIHSQIGNKKSKFRGVLSKMMFTDLTPIRRYTVEAVEVPAANYILALSSFTL